MALGPEYASPRSPTETPDLSTPNLPPRPVFPVVHLRLTLCASQGDKSLFSHQEGREAASKWAGGQPQVSHRPTGPLKTGQSAGREGMRARQAGDRHAEIREVPSVHRVNRWLGRPTDGPAGRERQAGKQIGRWPGGHVDCADGHTGQKLWVPRSSPQLLPTLQGKVVTLPWPGLATCIPPPCVPL